MKKWESFDYSTIDPDNFIIKRKPVYYFFKRLFGKKEEDKIQEVPVVEEINQEEEK